MHALLVSLTFCLIMLTAKAGMDAEIKKEMMEMMQNIGKECIAKEGATQADFDLLLTHQMPTSREGICVLACFNENVGMQNHDGKFSMEGSMAAIEIFKSQVPEVYEKMVKIFEKCIPPTEALSDRCEISGSFASCSKSYALELGLDETML